MCNICGSSVYAHTESLLVHTHMYMCRPTCRGGLCPDSKCSRPTSLHSNVGQGSPSREAPQRLLTTYPHYQAQGMVPMTEWGPWDVLAILNLVGKQRFCAN